jgi:N-formylglutamate deformylase
LEDSAGFNFLKPFVRMTPVLLHIPHSSDLIPGEYRDCFALDDTGLRRELIRLTDWFTDELFDVQHESVVSLRFPVSRLLVDPERFADDDMEPMAAKGMGVFYTRTAYGEILRSAGAAQRNAELFARYYLPHHAALDAFADGALSNAGRALIIDCHSFPSVQLPCHAYGTLPVPDICIGTDPFHTPPALADLAVDLFAKQGFSVAINHPFSGSLVPGSHYRKTAEVHSLMIEINRGLYMDEDSAAKSAGFGKVQNAITDCLRQLLQW